MWQSVEILSAFNIFSKTFIKKLEHRFLAEGAKIEKASFPYNTHIRNQCQDK